MAEDFCFRVESLIKAVQKQPILYNKKHRDYNNKEDKEQAWLEVCAEILPQWYNYDQAERNTKLFQVQRKWRNLRDSFRKDINIRRGPVLSKKAKKKREYIYYRSMLFLEPYLRLDEIDKLSKQEVTEDDDQHEIQEDLPSHETDIMKFESEESQYTDTSVAPSTKRKKIKPSSYEEHHSPVLEIWEGSVNGDINEETNFCFSSDIDEDRYFLLSLLPSFKSLSPQQKLSLKVEFLQVLQKISFPESHDPLNENRVN